MHMKLRKLMIAIVLGGLGLGSPELAGAGDKANPLRIERIALFKNGLGYATATTTLPNDTKIFHLGQLPVPAYGTFWVGYGQAVKVRKLTTAMESVEDLVPVTNLEELLRLNAGNRVVLHVSSVTAGQQSLISGVLVQPGTPARGEIEPPSPYFMDYRRADRPEYSAYAARPSATSVLVVKTEHGIVGLNPGSVQRVDFDGDPVCVTTNVPSYQIDLSDDKLARFSAQAQIINEMADLDEVQVDLVTGFPNIQFPELPNPVAMSQSLAEFLRALAAGRAEGAERGYMLQQQAIMLNSVAYASAPLPAYSTAANAQAAEDLFLYPIHKVSLKRGATATIPLFTTDMPYRHLYTWKIADQLDGERSRPLAEGKGAEEVWHVCRLVNAAKLPLTTAAAEFVKDGQFVGQDTCFYTASGAEASIRINRAMNVEAEQGEVELERKRNAENFYGYGYDLVKVAGELKVRNRLDKAIEMEISKDLSGEVIEKSGDAKDVQTARGLKQVNPKHQLTWTLKLNAGEERKITYRYQLYVRP
jgi:hypothetical protein